MKNAISFMLLILTIVMFVACATKKGAESGNSTVEILDVKWQLVELNGKKVDNTINGKTPFLELRSAENRYGASGGCNGIGGTYEISGNNAIAFSQGFSTKMACQNMEIENGIFSLFKSARTFGLDAEGLVLKDDQGTVVAKFKKMD